VELFVWYFFKARNTVKGCSLNLFKFTSIGTLNNDCADIFFIS